MLHLQHILTFGSSDIFSEIELHSVNIHYPYI